MSKKPIFVAFSTQKGGAGKSTFTILAASYLHYVRGLNIAVIDCDYPQCSVFEMRKREANQLETNLHYGSKAVAQFEALCKQTYPIICAKPEEGIERANRFLEQDEGDYDVVFFDLPGTINNDGVIKTFMAMDYVFAPMSPSRMIMESTLSFIVIAQKLIEQHSDLNLKSIHLFWNRIDGRVRRDWIEHYEQIINGFGLSMLRTAIPQSARYDKEQSIAGNEALFISTVFPPDKTLLRGSNLEQLIDEILHIINLNTAR